MSSWEERMADQAQAREDARLKDERGRPEDDPHYGHHSHLRGTMVSCSCGEPYGITSVVISEDYDPDKIVCHICGAQGYAGLPWDEDA